MLVKGAPGTKPNKHNNIPWDALLQSVLFKGRNLFILWNENILSSPVSCTVTNVLFKGMLLFILWNENIFRSPVSCTVTKCPIQWDEIVYSLEWKHFVEPSFMHCRKVSYWRGWNYLFFGMKTFCGAQFHAQSQSVLFKGDEIIYSLKWKHFVEPSFMHSRKVSYSMGWNNFLFEMKTFCRAQLHALSQSVLFKGMKLFILWNETFCWA